MLLEDADIRGSVRASNSAVSRVYAHASPECGSKFDRSANTLATGSGLPSGSMLAGSEVDLDMSPPAGKGDRPRKGVKL